MTLAEFIIELQKYPQDLDILFERDAEYVETVTILCKAKGKCPETIGTYNTHDDTIYWQPLPTAPKTGGQK